MRKGVTLSKGRFQGGDKRAECLLIVGVLRESSAELGRQRKEKALLSYGYEIGGCWRGILDNLNVGWPRRKTRASLRVGRKKRQVQADRGECHKNSIGPTLGERNG